MPEHGQRGRGSLGVAMLRAVGGGPLDEAVCDAMVSIECAEEANDSAGSAVCHQGRQNLGPAVVTMYVAMGVSL